MSTVYHLWLEGEAKGPFTISQLRSMWNSGKITGETNYTIDSGETWYPLLLIVDDLEPVPIAPLPAQLKSKLAPSVKVDEKIEDNTDYQRRLAGLLNRGWTVLSEGPTGAQLQGPKEMGAGTVLCLIFGTLLLIYYGSGIILIIAALIGHANKKLPTTFIARNASFGLDENKNPITALTPDEIVAEEGRWLRPFLVISGVTIAVIIALVVINAKKEGDKQLQDITQQLEYATPQNTTNTP